MLKLSPQSHVDHVPNAVISQVLERFRDKNEFFIETFTLVKGELENGLHGPLCGDRPVPDSECRHERRAGRDWTSRLVQRPKRQTKLCTVIGGPAGAEPCVLYTVFGGPPTPREPGDPDLPPEQAAASQAFWAEHALSAE